MSATAPLKPQIVFPRAKREEGGGSLSPPGGRLQKEDKPLPLESKGALHEERREAPHHYFLSISNDITHLGG